MGEVIRFTLDAKKITLLLHNNGSVSMLRNGENTYRGSPPTWDSILHWSNEWSTDDRALEAAYNVILPSSIDVSVKSLIIFMKKNNMSTNFYAKTDYLFVKTADDLVPLYVSSEGLVKYIKKVGYSFASVGLTEPEIWLLDKTDTLIRVGELDIGLNVVEEEALRWESDTEGTYRWLHPIYRWVTEKDADIIPEWLKKMVEKHPKFRGWIVSNTFEEDPPSTTCCPELMFYNTTSCLPDIMFSNTTACLPDYSQFACRDNSGNRVTSACCYYKDISGCLYKDNSGNRVTSACSSNKDISGCLYKDNSGNRVTSASSSNRDISGNLNTSCSWNHPNYVDVNTYSGYFDSDRNIRPTWSTRGEGSTYTHRNSTFAYSTTTQNPHYNYNWSPSTTQNPYNGRIQPTPCHYYDYDNLNSWQNQTFANNNSNMIYQHFTTASPESAYTNLIADVKRIVDRVALLQNEQFRLINDVKCKLNLLPNAVMVLPSYCHQQNVSTNVSSFMTFSSPNYSTNVSSLSTLGSTNISSFLKFSSPTLSTVNSGVDNISQSTIAASTISVKSGGCCTLS